MARNTLGGPVHQQARKGGHCLLRNQVDGSTPGLLGLCSDQHHRAFQCRSIVQQNRHGLYSGLSHNADRDCHSQSPRQVHKSHTFFQPSGDIGRGYRRQFLWFCPSNQNDHWHHFGTAFVSAFRGWPLFTLLPTPTAMITPTASPTHTSAPTTSESLPPLNGNLLSVWVFDETLFANVNSLPPLVQGQLD